MWEKIGDVGWWDLVNLRAERREEVGRIVRGIIGSNEIAERLTVGYLSSENFLRGKGMGGRKCRVRFGRGYRLLGFLKGI